MKLRALHAPVTRFLIARAPLLASAAAFFAFGQFLLFPGILSAPPAQPIAFNHAKHVENGLGCADCHAGVESGERAGLPGLSVCLGCHESAVTQSTEEAKIRALAAAGKEPEWRQLLQMPPHVFFSHRRHVQIGKLECEACHGAVEKTTSPPERAFRSITMDTCIHCHKERKAGSDCNDCHR